MGNPAYAYEQTGHPSSSRPCRAYTTLSRADAPISSARLVCIRGGAPLNANVNGLHDIRGENMMWHKTIFTLCLIFAFGSNAWGNEFKGLAGAAILPFIAYDFDSNNFGKGLELSAYALFLNIGASYRHWNNDLLDNENKPFQDEKRLYLGLGYLDFLQVQGGIASGKKTTTLRIKSELPWQYVLLGHEVLFPKNRNIIISPYYETDFKDRNIIGLCVGLLFY